MSLGEGSVVQSQCLLNLIGSLERMEGGFLRFPGCTWNALMHATLHLSFFMCLYVLNYEELTAVLFL